jgi:hypothetical protein
MPDGPRLSEAAEVISKIVVCGTCHALVLRGEHYEKHQEWHRGESELAAALARFAETFAVVTR